MQMDIYIPLVITLFVEMLSHQGPFGFYSLCGGGVWTTEREGLVGDTPLCSRVINYSAA